MIDIIEKALTKNQTYVLYGLNGMLWLTLAYVTFISSVSINIIIHPIEEWDNIFLEVLNGTYVPFVQWVLILSVAYWLGKYLLFKVLPTTDSAIRLAFGIMRHFDETTAVALENIYNKKASATERNKNRAALMLSISGINAESHDDTQKTVQLLTTILLKILLLSVVHMAGPLRYIWLDVTSIVLACIGILILEFQFLRNSGCAMVRTTLSDLRML